MKDDIAACRKDRGRLVREIPRKCLHRGVVADQQPVEADLAAHDLAHHLGRGRRWRGRIDRGVDDMRRHRHRQVGERLERREIVAAQLLERRVDLRQLVMRIGEGAAVAGNVLHHRQHAAGHQPFRRGAAHRGDRLGILAVGARADHVAGALDRHVEHRQAIDVDAEAQEVEGVQPRHQPGGAQAGLAVGAVERAERGARRVVRRDRRTQALHPAAFLVDEDRRVGTPDAVAQAGDEIG